MVSSTKLKSGVLEIDHRWELKEYDIQTSTSHKRRCMQYYELKRELEDSIE